jgi:hypothetical protein
MLKSGLICGLVLAAFLAGVTVARSQDDNLVVRAAIRDANTIPERIEYWELSFGDPGNSVTVAGPKELPLVSWLRRNKGRRIVVSIQRDATR